MSERDDLNAHLQAIFATGSSVSPKAGSSLRTQQNSSDTVNADVVTLLAEHIEVMRDLIAAIKLPAYPEYDDENRIVCLTRGEDCSIANIEKH